MKAVVFTQYGSPDVLQVKEVEKPTPKDNEIRVRVHASSVGYGDTIVRNFRGSRRVFNMPVALWAMALLTLGVNKPKRQILGSEFAGEVETVGAAVTRFRVGDAVFGYRGMDFGANAEYVCIAQDGLVELKPANVSFEEAATIPYGALTALSLLRRVDIQPGQKVLIVGASGAIGSAALQLAKHYGAEVTGIGGTQRQAYMKALGADHVIDYTKEDFTQNGQTYDLIFDVLGRGSFGRAKRSLNPHGRYFYASFKFKQLFQMMWTSRFGDKKVICAMSSDTQANLTEIKALVEAGKIKTVIDRCYPLEQTADAHRYIEAGQKHASIVISLMPVPMPA